MKILIRSILEILLIPFGWLWRRHERRVLCHGGDTISLIVISTFVLPGSVLKCRYENQCFALVTPADWKKLKETMPEKSENTPFSPFSLTDIPFVEDDELAQRVLVGSIAGRK